MTDAHDEAQTRLVEIRREIEASRVESKLGMIGLIGLLLVGLGIPFLGMLAERHPEIVLLVALAWSGLYVHVILSGSKVDRWVAAKRAKETALLVEAETIAFPSGRPWYERRSVWQLYGL